MTLMPVYNNTLFSFCKQLSIFVKCALLRYNDCEKLNDVPNISNDRLHIYTSKPFKMNRNVSCESFILSKRTNIVLYDSKSECPLYYLLSHSLFI